MCPRQSLSWTVGTFVQTAPFGAAAPFPIGCIDLDEGEFARAKCLTLTIVGFVFAPEPVVDESESLESVYPVDLAEAVFNSYKRTVF